MKLMQQGTEFSPIAIVFETADEAETFINFIDDIEQDGTWEFSDKEKKMFLKISNWFSNVAKL